MLMNAPTLSWVRVLGVAHGWGETKSWKMWSRGPQLGGELSKIQIFHPDNLPSSLCLDLRFLISIHI